MIAPDATHLRIGLTGLDCSASPEFGCSMARCLRKRSGSWQLIALSSTGCESGLFQPADDATPQSAGAPLWDGILRWPEPALRTDFLQAVDRWIDEHGNPPVDVLLPGRESDFEDLGSMGPELARRGIHCLVSSPGSMVRFDVASIQATCALFGMPSYWKETAVSLDQVWELAGHNLFPCHWVSRKGRGVAKSAEEYVALAERALEEGQGPILLAAIEESNAPLEYAFSGILAPGVGLLAPTALRVLSTDDSGCVWMGSSVSEPDLLTQMADIASRTGLVGPVSLRLRARAGQSLELIGVSAGFEPWIEMQAALEGSLPEALVFASLGLRPDTEIDTTREQGVLFSMTSEDRLFDVQDLPLPSATQEVAPPHSL